jgi:hypothetical protein
MLPGGRKLSPALSAMSFRARFTLRCTCCGRVMSSRNWTRTGRCNQCQEPVSSEFIPRRIDHGNMP